MQRAKLGRGANQLMTAERASRWKRAAGDRESWRPKGEHYEVRRGHAMQVAADGGAQHQMQSKSDVPKVRSLSRREDRCRCLTLAIKICMQYDVRGVCHVHHPPSPASPTVTAACSAEFLGHARRRPSPSVSPPRNRGSTITMSIRTPSRRLGQLGQSLLLLPPRAVSPAQCTCVASRGRR